MSHWCLEVWGDYACFTRPEMKVERVSYDVITPSASRAIFESILWKPAIRWNVTKIEVLKPIRWISVRRNEVGKIFPSPTAEIMKGGVGKSMGIYVEDERQQRAGLFLRDVRYRIHGYFDFIPPEERKLNQPISSELWADKEEEVLTIRADEAPAKYAAMFERRARKGQCFCRPYLGCREFSCHFKLVDGHKNDCAPIAETRDLGFMLYDMNFEDLTNPVPQFFRAEMKNGVIITDRKLVEVRG